MSRSLWILCRDDLKVPFCNIYIVVDWYTYVTGMSFVWWPHIFWIILVKFIWVPLRLYLSVLQILGGGKIQAKDKYPSCHRTVSASSWAAFVSNCGIWTNSVTPTHLVVSLKQIQMRCTPDTDKEVTVQDWHKVNACPCSNCVSVAYMIRMVHRRVAGLTLTQYGQYGYNVDVTWMWLRRMSYLTLTWKTNYNHIMVLMI